MTGDQLTVACAFPGTAKTPPGAAGGGVAAGVANASNDSALSPPVPTAVTTK